MSESSRDVTFSLIMPVYNVAPYLRDALDSICHQTFGNRECICVDDGSADDSLAVLREYAAHDGRIKIFSQSNQGPGPARNLALGKARGEWVAFVDGDDVLRTDALASCAQVIEAHPHADAVRFRHVEFADGQAIVWPIGTDSVEVLDVSQTITMRAYSCGFSNMTYRMTRVSGIAFPPYRPGQDRAWLSEALTKLNAIVITDKHLYGYRQRLGSTMHSAESVSKLKSSFLWRAYALAVLERSQKCVAIDLRKHLAMGVTEYYSKLFFKEADAAIRAELWPFWLENLQRDEVRRSYGLWGRFSIGLVVKFRSQFVAWFLFYLPLWLKLHGLHR